VVEYDAKSWLGVIARVRGTVLLALLPRVLMAVTLGVVAVIVYRNYAFSFPTTAHGVVGVALGLLLVFRTNTSYDRYWEGRKLLGSIVNRSRDLARQGAAFLGDGDEVKASRARLQRHIAALYALIRQYLRAERDLSALGDLLTESERKELADVVVRPCSVALWISQNLAEQARKGRLTAQQHVAMDANITSIVDSWGGAERIMKTPVPFAYAHHIKTFLSLFCFSLPFALVDTMKLATPFAVAVVAYGMFGIEEIGVEIEDPFGYDDNDLPLDAIGKTIERDTKLLLGQ
jgi:putative membrane protein